MYKCNRCHKDLARISYIEPDWTGKKYRRGQIRPPLCRPCWEKANEEATMQSKQVIHTNEETKITLDFSVEQIEILEKRAGKVGVEAYILNVLFRSHKKASGVK